MLAQPVLLECLLFHYVHHTTDQDLVHHFILIGITYNGEIFLLKHYVQTFSLPKV
jgi:hypothetical protein